jgi:3-deoxy-manno-octulosonate cytidylyltransferase (CMP-KDO synthetase)
VNHTGSKPHKNVVAIIPARYQSTRLPGKALEEIAGKPMICWVVERTMSAATVSRVIVATDDERIFDSVTSRGYEAMKTSTHHASGTDRIAEVAEKLEDAELIVNVQGDEPMIAPDTIDRAVTALSEAKANATQPGIATTWETIETAADVLDRNVVKIVVDESGRALNFSRSPIPHPDAAVKRYGSIEMALEKEPTLVHLFRKHTGLYVYVRDVLLEFARWPQSELERRESLEQLRALEHGVIVRAVKAVCPSIGVDTLTDLQRVRSLMESTTVS